MSNYNSLVYGIKKDTQIELREGQVVTIRGKLGSGGTTAVFDIGDGKALRIPKAEGVSPLGVAYEGYISWFYEGAEKVSQSQTPLVKVFSDLSWSKRFLIVEKLSPPQGYDHLYSFDDLLEKRVPENLRDEMSNAILEQFAPKTWELRFVSDMWSEQIVYTDRGWILADLSKNVYFARAVGDATLFSAMGNLPISWRIKLERKVLEARRSAELDGNFAQFLLARARRCINWLKGATASI